MESRGFCLEISKMALETRPGCSIFPPHLLKVLAGGQRHAVAHQNGLVALRMMHILFLGDKLDRVGGSTQSFMSHIFSLKNHDFQSWYKLVDLGRTES